MIKEKLKRGTFLYKMYLYYNIFVRYKVFQRSRKSFSQFGEDIFINEFFKNQDNGKYVDLGAFHPMRLNNTYFLHKKGWSGTNVDLNQISIDMFNLARKGDNNMVETLLPKSDAKAVSNSGYTALMLAASLPDAQEKKPSEFKLPFFCP